MTSDRRFYRVVQDPVPVSRPVLSIDRLPAGGVRIDWTAPGFSLEEASDPAGPYGTVSTAAAASYVVPAPSGQRFYRLHDGCIRSANVVGYVTLNLGKGFNLIANPLSYGDNGLNTILPLPDTASGTTVGRYDAAGQIFGPPIEFRGVDQGWSNPLPDPNWLVIEPGEGFFISVEEPLEITFIGDVLQGKLSNPIPGAGRSSYRASQVPQAAPLGHAADATGPATGLEFPAFDGDTVHTWNVRTQTWGSSWVYAVGLGWVSGSGQNSDGPVLPVGIGFGVLKRGPPDQSWERTFVVP